MRILLAVMMGLWPAFGWAASVDDLSQALRLGELAALMRDEGVADSRQVLPRGANGQVSAQSVSRLEQLFEPTLILHEMEAALADGLSPEEVDAATAFFQGDAGQSLVELELQARAALADDDIEAVARARWAERERETTELVTQLKRFAEVNDLLERNTTSTMSARYHFMRGLADGAGQRADDQAILSQIWARQASIRADTKGWLMGYLLLAYSPADPGDLADYVAFSETPTGQAVNAALFDGFGVAYERISYGLGLMTGQAAIAQDL